MKIDLQIDIEGADALLKRIQDAGANPRPALRQISELLVDSKKQRFRTSTAPDGSRWAPDKEGCVSDLRQEAADS